MEDWDCPSLARDPVCEVFFLPLTSPLSCILPKGTWDCAPAELNFLQWLQMCLRSLLPLSFDHPFPFSWTFLPTVVLDLEVCDCSQTEGVGISSKKIRRGEGPQHIFPLPSPCCLQTRINSPTLKAVFFKAGIRQFFPAVRAAPACQSCVWALSAAHLALPPSPGLMTTSHFVCCCLFWSGFFFPF